MDALNELLQPRFWKSLLLIGVFVASVIILVQILLH